MKISKEEFDSRKKQRKTRFDVYSKDKTSCHVYYTDKKNRITYKYMATQYDDGRFKENYFRLA